MSTDLVTFVIVFIGVGVLIVLSVLVGRADTASRAAAWRRIAIARRDVWEERQRLGCAYDGECAGCPFRSDRSSE